MENSWAKESFESLLASGHAFGPPYKIVKSMYSPSALAEFPKNNIFENLRELFPGLEPMTDFKDVSARGSRVTEATDPRGFKFCKVTANWVHDQIHWLNTKKAPGS